MLYADYLNIMQRLLVVDVGNTVFLQILPRMIDYAEQSCYRDLQLLDTIVSDSTATLSANSRVLNLPTDQHFFVIEDINVITPAGTTNPNSGTRNPLTKATKEFLNQVWPSVTGAAIPQYVATQSDQVFLVGPWSDQSYNVEFVGTIRPAPLSPTNTSTVLSLYLPDLFIAASMIFGAGYQRDFGAQTDDPQVAVTWKAEYARLLGSADKEEMKKRWVTGPPAMPQTGSGAPAMAPG